MSPFETLKITQVGGFAGNIALPPLVDLKREELDTAGRQALDDACAQLTAAAAHSENAAIGADIAGYRVEMSGRDAMSMRAFTLAPFPTGEESVDNVDVPAILASLLRATGVTS